MIFIAIFGVILRSNQKTSYYLPLGVIGSILIIQKELSREFNRKEIFSKIKSLKKIK